MARNMEKDGDWPRAARAYRKAIARGVDRAPVHRDHGVVLVKAGDGAAACAAFRRAAELEPGEATPMAIAKAGLLTGHPSVAEEAARMVRDLTLGLLRQELDRAVERADAAGRATLQGWLAAAALRPIRDPENLAQLDPAERNAGAAFWRDVAAAAR